MRQWTETVLRSLNLLVVYMHGRRRHTMISTRLTLKLPCVRSVTSGMRVTANFFVASN